ncbi:MAG: alpha amylase [Prevotella sp.]|nr:alpha amylase [Prevotella sp.]MBQ8154682.1 alpha amylase [Prevotella sp.]MBQ8714766.1 alpha amylase [Prevotella sp.]
MKFDTLTIETRISDGKDLTLLNQATGITTYEMDISYTQPEDVFFYTLLDTLGNTYRDTVYVKKENYPHFESVDCQAAYFHKITEVRTTHHIIDSIVIKRSTVNYDSRNEHFHIYFKARY